MKASPNSRLPGQKSDYLITNRRKTEDARNIMLETTAYYAKTELQSQFEESTNLNIRRKKLEHVLDEFRDQEKQKLRARQIKLKSLFEKDDEKFRQELIAQESTRTSRIDAMRARVAELKDKRETERKKIVEEKLLQQWKSECDELRRANSMILEKKVSLARADQLQEKRQQLAHALKERQYYDSLWEQDRQKKIQREEQDRLYRHESNQKMIQALTEQLTLLKSQAQREAHQKEYEGRLMRQEFQQRVQEEERNHQAKLQEQREMRQELDKSHLSRIQGKEKEARETLEKDLKAIQEQRRLDELEKKQKLEKRERLRHEMQLYRDHLAEQKRSEKQHEEEIKKLYQQEDDNLWSKKAEKWKKEQLAREHLMKEVMEGRQEQVEYHVEQNLLAQEQIRLEKEKLEAQIALIRQEDEEEFEKDRIEAEKYSQDLFDQIQSSRERKVKEKKRQELEDEAQSTLKKKYDVILDREMAKVIELSK